VGGKDKQNRPKIQFLNPRMYRGMSSAPEYFLIIADRRLGLGVSMGRSCVVNAIFFTAFEFTKKRINRISVNEELLHEHGL